MNVQQLDIFEPLARRTDPATSHEAARAAKKFADGHRALILETLREHQRDGMTVHEVAAYCRLNAHEVGKRMSELCESGRVVPVTAGESVLTRKSQSGRPARVMRAVS